MKTMKAIFGAFDRTDWRVFRFYLGLLLIGYGASQVHPGLGFALVGLLLVIHEKRLKGWL